MRALTVDMGEAGIRVLTSRAIARCLALNILVRRERIMVR
jgi:hypothetical protein